MCRTVGVSLAASLEPLVHCRNVASLSLFYRYDFGRCFSLQDSGAKNFNNKMPRQVQNFLVCICNTSAKRTVKNSAETFSYYVGNGFGTPRYFTKGYDLVS